MARSCKDAAASIVGELRHAGHEAFFAGGCVRDLFLGKAPKDYDIATSARPEELLQLYPKAGTVGAHFGVVLLKRHGHHFEIATFREDGEYRDGRHPQSVRYSTAEADAQRRDFTINGMFYDPLDERVLDYVGGQDDLAARLIRAIGDPDERFREDYLRLLRALRFAVGLEFEIENQTWAAIRTHAFRIAEISPERIRDELDKIWLSPHRLRGFDLLVESGLMEAILPEILELRGCEQPPHFHPEGDVFVHTRLVLSHLPPDASLPLVLSALFHDIAKPATASRDPQNGRIRFLGHDKLGAEMAEAILKRLRYPKRIIDAVVAAVSCHMQFMTASQMRTATLKRFLARENFPDELALHRADCLGSNGRLDDYEFIRQKQAEFAETPLLPPWFLQGGDFLERGWPSGPELGVLLTEAHNLQLDGTHRSREEALAWLDAHPPNLEKEGSA